MGTGFSSDDEKVEPIEMRPLDQSDETTNSVENVQKVERKLRTTTDIPFLIFMTFFYLILIGFLWYCVHHGDVYRIINGYDNCGNVCGRDNVRQKFACSGLNMTNKPFLLIHGSRGNLDQPTPIDRQCVAECTIYPFYRTFLNRCLPQKDEYVINTIFSRTGFANFFQEVTEDFDLCYREVFELCLIACGFSIVIIILLRYLVGLVVSAVLFGVIAASFSGTIILWILWGQSKYVMNLEPEDQIPDVDSRKYYTYLVFAITATVISIVVFLVITVVLRKRIKLVIQLFKESGKAVAAMPFLLLQPILTFFALACVVSLWFYLLIWVESAGFVQEAHEYLIDYKKDFSMKFTRWYNLLGMLWMCQFLIGCQHMIIAGAVSKWYFTRNKHNLHTPILESIHNLIRYHLGSVALGSFIVAVVQLIRVVLKMTSKYLNNKQGKCAAAATKCCQCCLYCFERVLKYLNRNAYIEIAINGYSFCKAGRQAFKVLVSNALRVAAINSVGDFMLFLGKVFVVVSTVLVGVNMLRTKEGIQHIWVPLSLVGLFAYFVSHCFLSVYEMTIDTIFLCFCEDCERNDGINRPYYMSKGLMKFVENSGKDLRIYDKSVRGQAWQAVAPAPSTIS